MMRRVGLDEVKQKKHIGIDEKRWKWEMKQMKEDGKGGMEHKKKVQNDEEK